MLNAVKRGGIWYLLAFGAILLISIGFLGFRVFNEQKILSEDPKDSIQWAAFQFQNEYNRFYQAVLEYDPADDRSLDAVRLRYDILFSRIALLEAAPSFTEARADPRLGRDFQAVAGPLKDLAPVVDDVVESVLADGTLEQQLRTMIPAMQKVMAEIVQFVGRESDARRAYFREALNYLSLATLLFLALLVLGVGILLIQTRRVHNSEQRLRQSEQDLAVAQEIAGVGSFRWDVRTGKLTATPMLRRIFGLSDDQEPTRQRLLDLIHPTDREKILNKYAADTADHAAPGAVKTSEVEYRVLRHDQSVRYVRDSARLIFGHDGRPVTISAAVLDTTEESKRRQALADSERHLVMAQELAQVGSFAWELTSGRIICSQQMRQIYALKGDKPTNVGVLDRRVHPDDRAAVRDRIQKLVESGLAGSDTILLQHRLKLPSGSERTVRSVLQLTRGGDNQSLRIIGTTQDVTAEHIQALALQEAKVAAERANLREELEIAQRREIIGLLAAGLAHDFNNLLATISGSASLIETAVGHATPAAASAIRIQAASDQAVGLVKRLLTLGAQRSAGVLIDLCETLREAADLVRPSLRPPTHLAVDLPDDPIGVMADPTDILQVVLNLAINARDALADQGGEITLSLSAATAADLAGPFAVGHPDPARRYVCLSVADTGPGMPAEVIARAFHPYFSTKGDKGTGLGLAVVSSVVSANGGAVRLDSAPGQGARFRVLWPCDGPAEAVVQTLVEGLTGSLAGKAILVVDDQEDVLHVLTAFLEGAGAEVAPSTDPADVIEALRDDPEAWDLLVTDYDMPGLTGAELAHRARGIVPGLPVVLVTALAGLAGRSGKDFDAVLGKPVQREALVTAAETAILASARRE